MLYCKENQTKPWVSFWNKAVFFFSIAREAEGERKIGIEDFLTYNHIFYIYHCPFFYSQYHHLYVTSPPDRTCTSNTTPKIQTQSYDEVLDFFSNQLERPMVSSVESLQPGVFQLILILLDILYTNYLITSYVSLNLSYWA